MTIRLRLSSFEKRLILCTVCQKELERRYHKRDSYLYCVDCGKEWPESDIVTGKAQGISLREY